MIGSFTNGRDRNSSKLFALGIKVYVLNMGLAENIPIGRLILNVMLAFTEFEDMIIKRTQEGKAIA